MRRYLVVILILVFITILASLVLAQGGELKVPWHSVAGGGGTSGDGARFTLNGIVGETAAGASSDGTTFDLKGGFLNETVTDSPRMKVYIPLVIR